MEIHWNLLSTFEYRFHASNANRHIKKKNASHDLKETKKIEKKTIDMQFSRENEFIDFVNNHEDCRSDVFY